MRVFVKARRWTFVALIMIVTLSVTGTSAFAQKPFGIPGGSPPPSASGSGIGGGGGWSRIRSPGRSAAIHPNEIFHPADRAKIQKYYLGLLMYSGKFLNHPNPSTRNMARRDHRVADYWVKAMRFLDYRARINKRTVVILHNPGSATMPKLPWRADVRRFAREILQKRPFMAGNFFHVRM